MIENHRRTHGTGMTCPEIGEVYGISKQAVEARVRKIARMLWRETLTGGGAHPRRMENLK